MKRETQIQRVIDRIDEVGFVSNVWAINNFILRLGALIFILKKRGWEFTGAFGTGPNRRNFIYTPTKRPVILPPAFKEKPPEKKESPLL